MIQFDRISSAFSSQGCFRFVCPPSGSRFPLGSSYAGRARFLLTLRVSRSLTWPVANQRWTYGQRHVQRRALCAKQKSSESSSWHWAAEYPACNYPGRKRPREHAAASCRFTVQRLRKHSTLESKVVEGGAWNARRIYIFPYRSCFPSSYLPATCYRQRLNLTRIIYVFIHWRFCPFLSINLL